MRDKRIILLFFSALSAFSPYGLSGQYLAEQPQHNPWPYLRRLWLPNLDRGMARQDLALLRGELIHTPPVLEEADMLAAAELGWGLYRQELSPLQADEEKPWALATAQRFSHWGEWQGGLQTRFVKLPLDLELGFSAGHSRLRRDPNQDNWQDLPDSRHALLEGRWRAHSPLYSSDNSFHWLNREQSGGLLQGPRTLAIPDSSAPWTFARRLGNFRLRSEHRIRPREGDALDLELQLQNHALQARYGLRPVSAEDWQVGFRGRFERRLEDQEAYFILGANYDNRRLEEQWDSLRFPREERSGGILFGYRSPQLKGFLVEGVLHLFYHNRLALQANPHLRLQWSPNLHFSSQVYLRRVLGFVDAFAVYEPYLQSSRQIGRESAWLLQEHWIYGWRNVYKRYLPERGWSWDWQLELRGRERPHEVLADWDSLPNQILFYQGQASRLYEALLQLGLETPNHYWTLHYGFREEKQVTGGQWLRPIDLSQHQAFAQWEGRFIAGDRPGFKALQLRLRAWLFSPRRLPLNIVSPWGERSPWQRRFDLELSYRFRAHSQLPPSLQKLQLHLGLENLDGRYQNLALLSPLDAPLAWYNLPGRRWTFGLNYEL